MVEPQHLENPYDAFFEAASKNDVKGLKKALRLGINIDALESEGHERRTALHMAARAGHLKAVKYLVRKGAKINIRDQSRLGSSTPLHAAASQANYEVMRYLLRHKAKPNVRGERGARPLHLVLMNAYEVTENHFHCIMVLIDYGAKIDSVAPMMGGRVADQVNQFISCRHHWMAQKLDWNLIRRGSQRQCSATGDPLLPGYAVKYEEPRSYAAGYANPEVAQLRIDRVIAAITLAVIRDRIEEVVRFLLRDEIVTLCSNRPLLHWAINAGSVRMVEVLLTFFSVNTKDGSGDTPLLQVCQTIKKKSFYYEIAALVLELGANTAARDSEGFTPLHLVGMDGDARMMNLLLRAGCDPNTKDSEGNTALIWCAAKIDTACTDSFDAYGWGTKPRLEVFQQLISAEPDLDAQNDRGHTALHMLTLCQAIHHPLEPTTLAALALLLESGASARLLDADGLSPLEITRIRHARDPARFEPVRKVLLKFVGPDAFGVDRTRAVEWRREVLMARTREARKIRREREDWDGLEAERVVEG